MTPQLPNLQPFTIVMLAIHERLRRLGVPAAQIFVHNHEGTVGVVPMGYDDPPTFLGVGPAWDGWEDDWGRAVAWWCDSRTTDAARRAAYQSVDIDNVQFVAACVAAKILTVAVEHAELEGSAPIAELEN